MGLQIKKYKEKRKYLHNPIAFTEVNQLSKTTKSADDGTSCHISTDLRDKHNKYSRVVETKQQTLNQ